MVDLVIKNGQVITPSGMIYGGVAVLGDKITHVGSDKSLPPGKRVIDAEMNFVTPGLIDPHVHMGSEEDISLEDGLQGFLTQETEGALHGGITTFGHFVGGKGVALVPALETTISVGEMNSLIDFMCHAFVMDENHLEEQPQLYRRGVTSFKHFFHAHKPGKDQKAIDWLSGSIDAGMLFRSLEFIAKCGYPCIGLVHCEEADITSVLEDRLREAGMNDLGAWTESHPSFTELMRIVHAFEIAKAVGANLYIVHISSAEGVNFVSQRRREGYPIWGETAPHYLTHSADMEEEVGCWGKVINPLRYSMDKRRLWLGILDGGITNIGTDHGTGGRTVTSKERGGGKYNNIWGARIGIRGGLEHMLPVMMTFGVHTGKISIEDLVKICSTNTAKAFGLYPKKGTLTPGSDADIVIIDPKKEITVDKDFYHCLCEVSIYEGYQFKGMARWTLVRGKVMLENYETVGSPGWGKFIPRGSY